MLFRPVIRYVNPRYTSIFVSIVYSEINIDRLFVKCSLITCGLLTRRRVWKQSDGYCRQDLVNRRARSVMSSYRWRFVSLVCRPDLMSTRRPENNDRL